MCCFHVYFSISSVHTDIALSVMFTRVFLSENRIHISITFCQHNSHEKDFLSAASTRMLLSTSGVSMCIFLSAVFTLLLLFDCNVHYLTFISSGQQCILVCIFCQQFSREYHLPPMVFGYSSRPPACHRTRKI